MTRMPTTVRTRRRILAASATLGVVAVLGGVPAAYADGGDPGQARTAAPTPADAGQASTAAGATTSSDTDASDDEQSDDQAGGAGTGNAAGGAGEQAGGTSDGGQAETGDQTGGEQAGGEQTGGDQADDGAAGQHGDDKAAGGDSSDQGGSAADGADESTTSTGESTTAGPSTLARAIIPDFGNGKLPITNYRLGVTRADGAVVPDGTSTVGSTLSYTVTGGDSGGGSPFPTSGTCTTTEEGPNGSSYCDTTVSVLNGSTITVTQTSANPGYVAGAPVSHQPTCTPSDGEGQDPIACSADATIADTGTLPSARDDAASTTQGRAVDIDVLANDDNGDGAEVTGTRISSGPAHGTAAFAGGSGGGGAAAITGGPVVRYVPQRGFTGTDTFRYTFSTGNGSATATVSVRVVGTPAAPRHDRSGPSAPRVAPAAAVEAAPATGALPDTGGVDVRFLGLGAVLLGAGGAATVVSRRRRPSEG